MIGFRRLTQTGLLFAFVSLHPIAARPNTIASVNIEALYNEADLVAIVRIMSGDAETYPITVYKAEVLSAYKGATQGQRIYLGPSEGYGVGNQYLVFLRKSETIPSANGKSKIGSYGELPSFYQIMYSGYGIMKVEYACVFDGAEIRQQCNYGIKLNPAQIILPKAIRTFPAGDAGPTTNYKKWVRKGDIISLIDPHF